MRIWKLSRVCDMQRKDPTASIKTAVLLVAGPYACASITSVPSPLFGSDIQANASVSGN